MIGGHEPPNDASEKPTRGLFRLIERFNDRAGTSPQTVVILTKNCSLFCNELKILIVTSSKKKKFRAKKRFLPT